MTLIEIKNRLKDVGDFNGWKGHISLYFTQKQLHVLKKAGIDINLPMKDIYNQL